MKFNKTLSSRSQGSMWTYHWTGKNKKSTGWFSQLFSTHAWKQWTWKWQYKGYKQNKHNSFKHTQHRSHKTTAPHLIVTFPETQLLICGEDLLLGNNW